MRAAMARTSRSSQFHSDDDDDDVDVLDSPSEIEVGTLAITMNDNNNKQIKELWQRPKQITLPKNGKSILRFEIQSAHIMPPENENTNIKRYVVYDLCISYDNINNLDIHPIQIQRRYTDFSNLYNNLKKEFAEHMTQIYFPKKVLIGNFSIDLIAERSTAFEALLNHILNITILRDSKYFVNFLQELELIKGCQYLDERRHELAVPIFENLLILLNKIYMDRSKNVIIILCRLVIACTTSPIPHPSANKWSELALRRFQYISDIDLLVLYIPLLTTCLHLWRQLGRDEQIITEHLKNMSKNGININGNLTLAQAIHILDPRAETI